MSLLFPSTFLQEEHKTHSSGVTWQLTFLKITCRQRHTITGVQWCHQGDPSCLSIIGRGGVDLMGTLGAWLTSSGGLCLCACASVCSICKFTAIYVYNYNSTLLILQYIMQKTVNILIFKYYIMLYLPLIFIYYIVNDCQVNSLVHKTDSDMCACVYV